ncbi:AAA domain-containing protein [Chryseobacterium sp. SN22]|uniref:McrB family protein n=1 Tax=Chryseobacterium sp. SN22 TaxID=2606431 RepID=UPI0011EEF18D|nr:AAA family ATPase [Chryseobacterium sp. SN22]KAA0127213.1 AAA domain-containing protein [Chryseobacterium sp. SN22]
MKTLQEIATEIDIWEDWRDKYGEFVPKFIEEAKKGNNWKDWDPNTFWEFFEKSNDQCISSLQQGYFSGEEKEKIKENWLEIAPLLQKIALSQDEPLFDTYHELKSIIKKYTKQNRKASTNRLIAGLQPKLLCTIVNEDNLRNFIRKLNEVTQNSNIPITGDWFKNSYAVWSFFLENLDSDLPYENMTLPWQIYEHLVHDLNNTNDMSEISAYSSTIINLLQYKNQIILQGPPGTGKTREAKLIAQNILGLDEKELQESEQFKIIQFHPSYTYEDFVRGIVAKPDDEVTGLIYDAENKILAKFAKEASRNFYNSSDKETTKVTDVWIDQNFEDFKNDIEGNLTEEEFSLSDKINIFKVRGKDFLYGKDWKTPGHLKFDEFKKLIKAVVNKEITLESPKLDKEKFVHSHYRFTYYNSLLQKFFEKHIFNPESQKENPKNYVLVIDEINRANLSSVLGELIYALEYRGEEVESMYEVDGSQKLVLPPNLYIIGTMNTADRSVGHIDYAIRRRFAFVDVLPKNLKTDDGMENFDEILFAEVKSLFTKDDYQTNSDYLADEFKPAEVALGHSYFIDKTEDGGSMDIRLEYEIKPILREYVKDGILKLNALDIIENFGKENTGS